MLSLLVKVGEPKLGKLEPLVSEDATVRGVIMFKAPSEGRLDTESLRELNRYGSINLTLYLLVDPYASGCSLCGMSRSLGGTAGGMKSEEGRRKG